MTPPYYQDDRVTLYHGDSREILPELSGVDLVFTSPPYNLGTCPNGTAGVRRSSIAARDLAGGYASYSDAMPQDEYDAWQRETVAAMWATLGEYGAIFYNHKPRIQRGVVTLPTIYGGDLPLRQVIVWDRGTGMNFSRSFFLPKCEWICAWAKPEWRLPTRSAGKVGDVWRIRPEHAADHPAPFPVELPTRAIEPTDARLVLDPFAGSGTTLLAARNLGRRAVGIEMSERYCEIAATRLARADPAQIDSDVLSGTDLHDDRSGGVLNLSTRESADHSREYDGADPDIDRLPELPIHEASVARSLRATPESRAS